MELEFHLNIFKELECMELEFLEWNSSSTFFFFLKVSFRYNSMVQKSSFTFETQFLENRVSKHGHIPK